jgi:hypothetical protein
MLKKVCRAAQASGCYAGALKGVKRAGRVPDCYGYRDRAMMYGCGNDRGNDD